MRHKKTTEIAGCWPHRPGFNWLLGYYEGEPAAKSEGVREVYIDRNIRDGKEYCK